MSETTQLAKLHGQKSLVGYGLWRDCKEMDMTEHTHVLTHTHTHIARKGMNWDQTQVSRNPKLIPLSWAEKSDWGELL